ncbi:acyl-CoA dehydrogenase family protein [Streptomyces purpureus]|uniref:Acyl-CoA dehydrogenase n=1 Tax=Streptomyces purpureus TaxID=1951 RepID=A0A918GYG6_9ACTN|nr:acyl-CoA dehydrogenase family protein [Streptomyces purpureus]GGT23586.1 hypothetical protein GCM10014713_15610 [Streptomyces purpureus]
MRFLLTDEQQAFARALDTMLGAADTAAAVRAWGAGDHTPGRAVWTRLAEAGVWSLAVPEAYEGVGPLPVETVVAFVELGRHAVPGPLAETAAAGALLSRLAALGHDTPAKRLLPGIVGGGTMATLVVSEPGPPETGSAAPRPEAGSAAPDGPPEAGSARPRPEAASATPDGRAETVGAAPRPEAGSAAPDGPPEAGSAAPRPGALGMALDADAADAVLVVQGEELRLAAGHGPVVRSLDPARRLARPDAGGEPLAVGPAVAEAAGYAARWAALATAAQSLGVGLALLERTVSYVKQRSQFGTPIGSFQAVKHRLADTLLALEFARPLLYGAALTLRTADVAAAKAAAGEAGYAAARTALQLHGAVGYTEELDLSLWLRKARPLRDAWGTPARCRALVLDGLGDRPGGFGG